MELIDALHLRGWRIWAVIGVALFGCLIGVAMPRAAAYEAEHVLFAGQLAGDALTPAQIEDFADELRLAATLPAVELAVDDQVDGGYDVEVRQTSSDSSVLFVAESDDSLVVAQAASRLTAIESSRFVLDRTIQGSESLRQALEAELATIRSAQDVVVIESGGIEPTSALARASELLFDARQAADEGDVAASLQATRLEQQIATLRPLAQTYEQLDAEAVLVSTELGRVEAEQARAQNSYDNVDSELVIAEVSSTEKSQLPVVTKNMLLFAVLNSVALIAAFIILDRFFPGDKAESVTPGGETDSPTATVGDNEATIIDLESAQATSRAPDDGEQVSSRRSSTAGAESDGEAADGRVVANATNGAAKSSRQSQARRPDSSTNRGAKPVSNRSKNNSGGASRAASRRTSQARDNSQASDKSQAREKPQPREQK